MHFVKNCHAYKNQKRILVNESFVQYKVKFILWFEVVTNMQVSLCKWYTYKCPCERG